MSGDDGFLSRWSRRKLEKGEPSPAEEALTAAEAAAPQVSDSPLSPEAIAALPRIEDLTAGTDLAPFLRAGVPGLLRKAALRRMWSLDPAIRDTVGDARDYAYDWNLPGDVPGSGPLLPSDDVQATLSRMFEGSVEDAAPDLSRNVPDGDEGESQPAEALTIETAPPSGRFEPADESPPDSGALVTVKPAGTTSSELQADPVVVRGRRRHGTASPS